MPENFEDVYYKNLQKGTALNLPEVIARAIRNKGPQVIEKNKTYYVHLFQICRKYTTLRLFCQRSTAILSQSKPLVYILTESC